MLEETLEPQTEHDPEATTWDAAVVGAGYVGVPLAQTLAEAGRSVLLVDISEEIVAALNRGVSHIGDVPSEQLAPLVRERRIRATTDYNELRHADAILIALPTPLSKQREPDLSIVIKATEQIGARLRNGHLVILESTTYPRTTREVIQPILERTGLKAGRDFHLAFSPERVDPGNEKWTTKNVPKRARWIPSIGSQRPRPPSSRSCSRTSSAGSTSPSSTSWRSCASGWTSTSGK
jgi:UDP-N-acetyl-D-glucosamine dehydrogenase